MMLNVFLTLHHVLTILTLVWAVLLGKEPVEAAASPRYCGTLGSGVDRLRPPGPGWTLTQVQVVARHGARTPVADCGPWLPGARGARWTCPVGHAERIDAGLLDDALADATALPLGVVAGVTVEIGADAAACAVPHVAFQTHGCDVDFLRDGSRRRRGRDVEIFRGDGCETFVRAGP